jgi:peptidoglycan hydrolase CwlO-like protein
VNPTAILALIGDLYEQVNNLLAQLAERDKWIAELKGESSDANGAKARAKRKVS